MTRQISPEQAATLSSTLVKWKPAPHVPVQEYERFIKPGETQSDAIRRLKSFLTRRARNDSRHSSMFPTFVPGRTTTAAYVALFETKNYLFITGSASHLNHPAPFYKPGEDIVEVLE